MHTQEIFIKHKPRGGKTATNNLKQKRQQKGSFKWNKFTVLKNLLSIKFFNGTGKKTPSQKTIRLHDFYHYAWGRGMHYTRKEKIQNWLLVLAKTVELCVI